MQTSHAIKLMIACTVLSLLIGFTIGFEINDNAFRYIEDPKELYMVNDYLWYDVTDDAFIGKPGLMQLPKHQRDSIINVTIQAVNRRNAK